MSPGSWEAKYSWGSESPGSWEEKSIEPRKLTEDLGSQSFVTTPFVFDCLRQSIPLLLSDSQDFFGRLAAAGLKFPEFLLPVLKFPGSLGYPPTPGDPLGLLIAKFSKLEPYDSTLQ